MELANQIAAGEVIERPSSVVKELVENSIDAGAKNISVFIEEAGRKKIVVSDDGSGLDKEDASLAFLRHATSKIYSTYDLFKIKTLGFRGEALPSIASISKVTLESCTKNGSGIFLTIANGETIIKEGKSRQGTKISVEELFYNTPARLKYLKLDYTENAVTLETLTKIALAHPDIAFSLTFDDKLKFSTTGRGDLAETIMSIYGVHTIKNIMPFTYEHADFKVTGYLGNTELTRANRYAIITNLNGRNVYMPRIQNAISEAYHGFIAPQRYPFVVLNFEVESALVDVNVHPTKKEVRFSKENILRDALLQEIPKTLVKPSFIASQSYEKTNSPRQSETREQITFEFTNNEEDVLFFRDYDSNHLNIQDNEPEIIKVNDSYKAKHNFRPLGALHQTYIICEDDYGGFALIDQHAAHERINYEKFQKALNLNLKTRPLLLPYVLNLSASERHYFDDLLLAELKTLGLDVEPFGFNTLRVTGVPAWQEDYDEKTYIDEMINMVIETKKINYEILRTNAIATMACKASIKAKQRLSILEMEVLINDLFACNNPYSCPHGRPTIIQFNKYELEKMFKRTGT